MKIKYDYDYKRVTQQGTTYNWANQYIREGSRVLEIGPSTGIFCRYLVQEKHCMVDIIEYDEEAGQQAAQYANIAAIGPKTGSIEDDAWETIFLKDTYDYILMLDVLEHLHNPQKALQTLYPYLKKDGKIIVSTPNISHNTVLLQLFQNQFEYSDTGLLDNTHIHFFSYSALRGALENAGYSVIEQGATFGRVGETEIATSYSEVPIEVAKALRCRNNANLYQFLLVCDKNATREPLLPLLVENLDTDVYKPAFYVETEEGEGFPEDKREPVSIEEYEGTIQIQLDLSPWPNARRIRYTPMNRPCVLRDIIAKGDGQRIFSLNEHNGVSDGKSWAFLGDDPAFVFDFAGENYKTFDIEYKVAVLDDPKVVEREAAEIHTERKHAEELHQKDMVRKEAEERAILLKEKTVSLEERVALLEAELVAHHTQLEQVLHSRSWRLVQKLAGVLRKLIPPGSARAKLVRTVALRPARFLLRKRAERREAKAKHVQFGKLEPLTFPTYEQPLVSIIIPCYNQLHYTWNCLQSVYATGGQIPYEVILADDNSTDDTKRLGEKVKGIRIVRNKENLRFLRNCNEAAKYAQGKYLIFLNNDTEVHEDWLQSLVQLMEDDEHIGVAGSKLLFADGKLQEAGGILWDDGSAWNYGRGQDPEASEFNYVKEVDYVSGCSLIVRADLWQELGGFDERYAPAYCEDSDLCFEARKHGYKVMYQPLSVLTHFEGVSNGTDLAEGLKQYQVENSKKFFEKWKDELQANHYPNGQHVLKARDRTKGRKHLLLIDHYVPTYDQDAGNRTIYDYICLFLQEGYHVTMLPANFAWTEKYTAIYQQMGVEVLYGSWYRDNWKSWLKENGSEYDVVFLSRPHISIHFIDEVREYTRAKILYYGHDLHFLRETREYELTGDETLLESIERWHNIEFSLINKADWSFYPSSVEAEVVKKEDPEAQVSALPGYIFQQIEEIPYHLQGRDDLLFVGGFGHPPNKDAMLWFVEEIWPRLLQLRPDMRLHIVGSRPPEEIKELASEQIVVHGFVSDEELDRLYRTCRLNVAPLRYGAGVKGKVIESLAKGLPIVTTAIGAEGIDDAEKLMVVEDNADAFANTVATLYTDETKLADMAAKGCEYVQCTYSAQKVIDVIDKALAMTSAMH